MTPQTIVNNLKSMMIGLIKRDFWLASDTSRLKTVLRLKNGPKAEHLQDWGFISVPPLGGGEALVVYPSATQGSGIVIKADKPELRPEGFAPGDSGLFNDKGVVVKLSGTSVSITGATSIDLGEATQKLVNESFIQLFNTHVHANLGVVPTVLATEANTTTKVGAE